MSRYPQSALPQGEVHENLLSTLFSTVNTLFGVGSLVNGSVFQSIYDPRQSGKIRYSVSQICWTGVLLFLERLAARSQVSHIFNQGDTARANLGYLLDLPSVPHGDTMDYLFRKLAPEQVQTCVTQATLNLILTHKIPHAQLLNGDWRIAIDGTELFSSGKPLFAGCLFRKLKDDTVEYYAKALEAKLICTSGQVFSLCTEFIEEQVEGQNKQDCELKAFYRLAEKLRALLPENTAVCLVLDALFAAINVFEICETNNWHYIITLKPNDLKKVNQFFENNKKEKNQLFDQSPTEKGYRRQRNYSWLENISYQTVKLTVIQLLETTGGITKTFRYLTNLPTNFTTVQDVIQNGRNRWKIENQGFNTQKNQGFDLEHAYGKDRKAYKIYYLLLQLAHTITQLMELSSQLNQTFRNRITTQKNVFRWLTEAIRNYPITPQKIEKWRTLTCQFHFPQKQNLDNKPIT